MIKITFRIFFALSFFAIVFLVSVGAFLLDSRSTISSSSDLEDVESTVRDYIEGWYTGNVERMDRALHDNLVKRIPVRDSLGTIRLHAVSKERMLELTNQGGGENPDAVFKIFVDDVSIDIAAVRVESPDYLDYLHLVKTLDGWKIVNDVFHARK